MCSSADLSWKCFSTKRSTFTISFSAENISSSAVSISRGVLMSVSHSFALTDEQEQLRKEIRDFAAREIAPNVMRWDEASEFPQEVVGSWAKWA